MSIRACKYTFIVVTKSRDKHRLVIMANNGKPAFNEEVSRAAILERGLDRLTDAIRHRDFTQVRMTEAAFRAKYPKFPKNARPKKKAAPKAATKATNQDRLFAAGDKVKVYAGVWGTVRAEVIGYGKHNFVRLRITSGKHKDHEGQWGEEFITRTSK